MHTLVFRFGQKTESGGFSFFCSNRKTEAYTLFLMENHVTFLYTVSPEVLSKTRKVLMKLSEIVWICTGKKNFPFGMSRSQGVAKPYNAHKPYSTGKPARFVLYFLAPLWHASVLRSRLI